MGAPNAGGAGASERAASTSPLPDGWRKRARSMLNDEPAAQSSTEPAHPPIAPTNPTLPRTHHEHVGKRFQKVGGRGPGALVRLKMETVGSARDEGGADGREEMERAEEDNDELFEEAVATRGRRVRR